MSTVRTRFAPSPTGHMHVGNLRTALFEYLVARSLRGEFVLRIEDTDRQRYVEGAEQVIYDTLRAVGITHDEGPDVGGAYGPYVQSARKESYRPYAEKLVKEGTAYYCFCSKSRLDSLKDENGLGGYDRHCRDLPKEEVDSLLQSGIPYVVRQKIPKTGTSSFSDLVFGEVHIDNKEIEDQILLKSDGYPTYNFANVIDDHEMKISHVVRGCEYITSTPKYNLLYEAFGFETPIYIHLPLIMGKNEDGSVSKLSKRHGATSFDGLVAEGYLPEAIVNYIALLGWSPEENREIFTLCEMCEEFSIKRITKSPALFDYKKLTWMNGEYILAMDEKTFLSHAMPYYEKVFDSNKDFALLQKILQTRIEKFEEIPEKLYFFCNLPEYPIDYFTNKKSKTNPEVSLKMLNAAISILQELTSWDLDTIHNSLISLATKLEVKNGTLLWPVRIAAAGTQVTPGGATEILTLLGQEETLRRLKFGKDKIESEGWASHE